MMMGAIVYLDTILVPSSLFLMVAYHSYLWHCLKHKPSHTTIGVNALRRKTWFLQMEKGDDKKGMLAVQSLRNALMETIITASIAVVVNLSLATLANNSYSASHLPMMNNIAVSGSQSSRIYILKFGSASLFLLASFLCSSMGLGFLIDANFLVNASVDGEDPELRMLSTSSSSSSSPTTYTYAQTILERGNALALIGNRVLCIAFPLLAWMFGPIPVALSSIALVRSLYSLDFSAKFASIDMPVLSSS